MSYVVRFCNNEDDRLKTVGVSRAERHDDIETLKETARPSGKSCSNNNVIVYYFH